MIAITQFACKSENKKIRTEHITQNAQVFHLKWNFVLYSLNSELWIQTFRITSAAAMPGYGVDPNVTISHIRMPKLQVSDFTENILS